MRGASSAVTFLFVTQSLCQAFIPCLTPSPATSHTKECRTRRNAFESIDIGIAVVSAAAGAAMQLPRINQLQRELEITRTALTASEQEMVSKISELEDKLFVMDKEYEAQTSKFKKQYDLRMREDLERITEKLKTDFRYNLEIKLEEDRSKRLSQKLDVVSAFTAGGNSREELAQLRFQRERINNANAELEKALEDSSKELELLRHKSSKKGWWPF